jgi:hypothetical protein
MPRDYAAAATMWLDTRRLATTMTSLGAWIHFFVFKESRFYYCMHGIRNALFDTEVTGGIRTWACYTFGLYCIIMDLVLEP